MAVAGDEVRVHGLQGLRIISASAMRAVASTKRNALAIVVAEKGTAIIKGTPWQRPAAS